MENQKNSKASDKKLNAANFKNLREQLVNRISQLNDEELEAVAGGTITNTIGTLTNTINTLPFEGIPVLPTPS